MITAKLEDMLNDTFSSPNYSSVNVMHYVRFGSFCAGVDHSVPYIVSVKRCKSSLVHRDNRFHVLRNPFFLRPTFCGKLRKNLASFYCCAQTENLFQLFLREKTSLVISILILSRYASLKMSFSCEGVTYQVTLDRIFKELLLIL